jgi:hypothetical protein
MAKYERVTVDASQYPDLVVIYLGMRVRSLRGLKTLLSFGPQISKAAAAKPDGLLLHEQIMWGLFPPHLGMRQYWRDFDSLERWARTGTHLEWWKNFFSNPRGTGFWHETYANGTLIESLFLNMPPTGLSKALPTVPARGSMFSARRRLGKTEPDAAPLPISEEDIYADTPGS